MRKAKWICISCLAFLAGFSGDSCASYGLAGGPVRQAAEIPFEMYNDNLVVVEGTIGSKENVKILLDTGTGATIVGPEIVTGLNVRENPGKVSLATLGSSMDARSVTVSQIKIGALHLSPATVVVQDLSSLNRQLGVSIGAIAGLDVLGTGNFMIDFSRRKVVFAPNELPGKFVRFETRKPFLTVKATIGGQELRLLVDSGTPGLLVFRDRLRATSTKLKEFSNSDARMFTAAGTTHAKWLRASDVSLGTQNIGPQVVLVADNDPGADFQLDGLLGFATTGFQRVWFDFENGLFGWS